MKFRSTRGGVQGVTFADALQTGYAPDGGLYVPEVMPKVSTEELQRWRTLSFPDLALALFDKFLGDEIPAADLKEIVHSCYDNFSCPEKVPVRRVGSIFVSELFHGPTFCFKDLGQQPLIRFLAYFAGKRGSRHTVLVATTGDTGPAAIRAVGDSGSANIQVKVFFPEGQISELQRRQMTTVMADNAQVIAFQGGGDDMDLPLKRMGQDVHLAKKHGICGINSYNIGRPVSQMPHYFWTYFRVIDQLGLDVGKGIDLVIPTGAMGNLLAATMAKLSGLPIQRLVAGVNVNDITDRTFRHGEFHRSETMHKTLSDAINIQVPYNFERILYYLVGEDSGQVKTWMGQMEATNKLTLPAQWLRKLQETYTSLRVTDDAMLAAMRRCLDEHAYLVDPHTAVAMATAWDHVGNSRNDRPVAVLATASPCKFEAAVTKAIGAERWAAYQGSKDFPEEGRRVMAATERPFRTFLAVPAEKGGLAESQKNWEAEVRKALDSPHSRL